MGTKFTVAADKMKRLDDFDPRDMGKTKKDVQAYVTKKGVKETVEKVDIKGTAVEITIKGDDPTAVKALFK
jgi:hypothetical protein